MTKKARGSHTLKRKGLEDHDGSDSYHAVADKKVKQVDAAGIERKKAVEELAKEYAEAWFVGVAEEDKPFLGAQPLLLKKPCVADAETTERVTSVACKTIEKLIQTASGVHVRIGDDARQSPEAKALLEAATDEVEDYSNQPLLVSIARDMMHTYPGLTALPPAVTGHRLLIYVGTPSRYLSMCIKSQRGRFDKAYEENRLVVLCRGVCMLPLGTQEQNTFGVDENEVLKTIVSSLKARGAITWGHGRHSKAKVLSEIYGYPEAAPMPEPLSYTGDAGGSVHSFDYLLDYVKFLNQAKMAKPQEPVCCWYDTGLLVSVLTGTVAQAGVSILTDSDGLQMQRDASIGHIISKLNQMICVEPYSTTRGVYNFWIGDGACRLNGGVELAFHLMEDYKAKSMTTLWIFNNEKWAIEDNLVAGTFEEHHLYNHDFYGLLQHHDNVVMCTNDLELRETVALLSRRTAAYLAGKAEPSLNIVVVRGIDVELPPVLGDIEPIMKSSEMAFMKSTLGKFAEGCMHKVPIYGCSAFEYIQYLHLFLDKMPEGKRFQYICGRTDIQASHMAGMAQPEGKAVLFINDVYGVNSLGESIRSILAGYGGKQLLVMIWHPSLIKLIDHFHLHRPPMVWPSIGPELIKYYIRKESDACFAEFGGKLSTARVTQEVTAAIGKGTPIICVNMLPEQERAYVSLDIRVKTGV